jgi:hypothetical protein
VAMSGFKPSPVCYNISSKQKSSQKQQLPQSLEEAKMVFVKNDGSKKPLAPLYSGPYLALDRNPHYFTVQLGGQQFLGCSRLLFCKRPSQCSLLFVEDRGKCLYSVVRGQPWPRSPSLVGAPVEADYCI